jgi:hypothetical protein
VVSIVLLNASVLFTKVFLKERFRDQNIALLSLYRRGFFLQIMNARQPDKKSLGGNKSHSFFPGLHTGPTGRGAALDECNAIMRHSRQRIESPRPYQRRLQL